MHIVFAYIKFLLRSTNQHGVHSPFVYNLVTKCVYDKGEYPAYSILKQYRRSLLKDKRIIQITDFGAGSRVFKSDKRKISEIAKNAGLSPKRTRLLNRLVRYLEVDQALELGTSLGLGTSALAAGNEIKITTIEGCPETAAVAREKFEEFGFNNIQLKVGKFENYLLDGEIQNSKFKIQDFVRSTQNRQPTTHNSQLATGNRQQGRNSKSQISNSNPTSTENRQPTTHNSQLATGNRQPAINNPQPTNHNSELLTHNFDLIYIDGNHQKEATLDYFEKLLPTIHNDSVMIFDDIHWSKGMEEAWEEIKAHPQVRVTVDTFQWGLVFFRKEQEKEDFVIRL